MKFLLMMPKLANSSKVKYNFPIGISYVSSALKKADIPVDTLNPNHAEDTVKDILKTLAPTYDVILTGGLSGQIHAIKDIIDAAKVANPQIITIVGGGVISSNPSVAMDTLTNADIGVIGEGEITNVELCKCLDQGHQLSDVAGIVYRSNGALKQNARREVIENLDSIPFPDLDGFDIQTYLRLSSQTMFGSQGDRTFFILTARSCPFNCTFCYHTLGNKYRVRSLENVFIEIELLRDKYGITQFVLSDELFASDKRRVMLFSQFMKDRHLSWYATFRIDHVDNELIEIIKKSTCKQMFFGIESVNDGILKSMHKNLTRSTIECNLKKVYDANIPFGGNLLFGDPQDTFQTCKENIEWYHKHPKYNLSLININAYPGTRIYKDAVDNGLISDEKKFLLDNCPVINLSRMSDAECASIQKMILECNHGVSLTQQKLLSFNPETKQTVVYGRCIKCGTYVKSENILLFTKDYSYIYCPNCGVKHIARLPHELEYNLIYNIKSMLENRQKIVLWGVHPGTWSIFNSNEIFKHPDIIFVDSNHLRQNLKITDNNKSIFDPRIFQEEDFNSIVFCYPHLYSSYADSIKSQYPSISNFVDILSLLSENID